MNRLARHVLQEIFKRHHAGGASEDVVTDLRLDLNHQLFENLEGFGLVLDERVALAIGAQPDGIAQAIHVVKMLLPQPVNGSQNRVSLNFPQLLRVFKTHLQFVGFSNLFIDEITRITIDHVYR